MRNNPLITAVTASLLLLLSAVGQAQEFQDPTRPSVAARNNASPEAQRLETGGFPKVVVNAVMLHANSRQAVLNGEVVSEGQRWSGVSVVKIHQQGVILANDEKRREFLINTTTILKENANEF